jgi:hypothetical protein
MKLKRLKRDGSFESGVNDHLFCGRSRPFTVVGASDVEYVLLFRALLAFSVAGALIAVLL